MKGGKLSFDLRYELADELLDSPGVLRFLSCREIEERLATAGLHVETLLGGWTGEAFVETSSDEMIFLVRTPA